ncbi:hypothetical protein [Actinocorallia longicatena]|uniref:Uncharacterized protein n=1 Tax=Actinocorallia longicatena TaxID=111803 RepID=A0ABP6Q758_9ACTN
MWEEEQIIAEVAAAGPVCITRHGRRYPVRVIEQWQEPGGARQYRLQVAGDRGVLAIAEVVARGQGFALRHWWT